MPVFRIFGPLRAIFPFSTVSPPPVKGSAGYRRDVTLLVILRVLVGGRS